MTVSLLNNAYTCDQARALDHKATSELGVAGITLMKRAGRAAYSLAQEQWPDATQWIVLCGAGNNAGDGYVFAALAAQRRQPVQVYWLSDPDQLTGDAATAFQYARQEGVLIAPFKAFEPGDAKAVIIDAMLGTGATGQVRPQYAEAVAWANQQALPVFSIDVPSGLCADTGAELGTAVKASATLTFIARKIGLLTGRGPTLTGALHFSDLALPATLYEGVEPVGVGVDREHLMAHLPVREADAHKGQFGHVMVIGGDRGFGGAAIMAAEMAMGAGAGLVSLATQADHVSAALTRRPEVMAVGVSSGQELEPLLNRPTVLVVGPGLGQSPWSEQLLQQALKTRMPWVIDADGLNMLAQGRFVLPDHPQWVLTPHPGEAARLLGKSVAEVQSDRIAAIQELHHKFGGVILLKGAGTLIYDGKTIVIANVGSPALATGGTGDVLSGLIGALLAQGLEPFVAAQLGACLHGDSADRLCSRSGQNRLLAAELIPYVRELIS